MEDEDEVLVIPNCPYCGDTGECKHVLLDYDASFKEWLSGYLKKNRLELFELQDALQELIKSGINPTINDFYLESIWNYAKDNFTAEEEGAELDTTAYFNFLDENISDFHGEAFHYSDPDGAPGYSSSYIIYYSKTPKTTMQKINEHIISVFKNNEDASINA